MQCAIGKSKVGFVQNQFMQQSSWHGTLEIVDETTPVTLFIGEDEQRPLAERVAKLLPKICANYTIIDSKAWYELPGISENIVAELFHFS